MRAAVPLALVAAMLGCGGLSAATVYVDSTSTNPAQDGSQAAPWHALTPVNATTFAPGDVIALRRGALFSGRLAPRGSGAPGAPITVTAYGAGTARPRIDGAGAASAVELFDQQGWELVGLDVTGGTQYGIHVAADQAAVFSHIRIADCVVHDITATPRWDSGLIVVAPYGTGTRFADVVVEDCTAANTNLWYGIHVGFNFWSGDPAPALRSTDVVIRRCAVHDVYGDNITVADVDGALIERCTAWNGGRAPAGISYTPNAIWSWSANAVTIQYNEAYGTASYGVDGGAYDVDWGSTNTLIQYNYAHDNQGYAVAIFGAHNTASANSIVRFNVFAHDGQHEIYFATWDGGWIDGAQVYGNTVVATTSCVYSPGLAHAAGAMAVRDNILVSTGGAIVDTGAEPAIAIDHDLGWGAGAWSAAWGPHADPLLSDAGYHAVGFPTTSLRLGAGSPAAGAGVAIADPGAVDFFGDALAGGAPTNAGADQRAMIVASGPYGGVARAIPGTIQAEDFDEGGEGVAYHDRDAGNNGGGYRATDVDVRGSYDVGGGWQVGWFGGGEWLRYSVAAASAGTFSVDVRVASGDAGATVHVEVDGADVTGPMTFGNTGGWDAFADVRHDGIAIAAGAHVVRLVCDSGALDCNWLAFTAGANQPPNLLRNPGFEADGQNTQTPTAWSEWGGSTGADADADAAYTESYGGAHAGGWHLTHWKPTAYEVYSWQIATGLADGTYSLSAWVRGSGGQAYAWMEAKDYGSAKLTANVPATGAWTRIAIDGVAVRGGACTVGFYSKAAASQWIYVDDVSLVRTDGGGSTPYGGVARAIPGRIQAEDFDDGGEGVAYHDSDAANNGGGYRATAVDVRGSSDVGGGWQVGWFGAGEWLRYTVAATAAGSYAIDVRVANGDVGGTVHVEVDGVDVTGPLSFGNTGNWDTFVNLHRDGIAIGAGTHVVRLVCDGGGLDCNWLEFAPSAPQSVGSIGATVAVPAG